MTASQWMCPACEAPYEMLRTDGLCPSPCMHDFEAAPTVRWHEEGDGTVAEEAISNATATPLPADCRHCDAPVSSDLCAECGLNPRGTRLVFPWGDRWVGKGPTVTIGRHASEFAGHLQNRKQVGREHVRVQWTDERDPLDGRPGVHLFDLDSRNGTFIDGERIAPFKPTFVKVGSIVRLSQDPDRGLELRIEDV